MLPIVFEWHWEIGRLIFMGITYVVLGVIASGLIVAFSRTLKNLKESEASD